MHRLDLNSSKAGVGRPFVMTSEPGTEPGFDHGGGGAEPHKRNFLFWLTHILLSFLNRINMPVTVIRGNIRGNRDLSTDRNTTTQDM